MLRELLLTPLSPDIVRWGTPVTDVIARADGRYALRSAAASLGTFDLVIGADGAGSTVRAALTGVRPHYSGITFVELWLEDVDRQHPVQAASIAYPQMIPKA